MVYYNSRVYNLVLLCQQWKTFTNTEEKEEFSYGEFQKVNKIL